MGVLFDILKVSIPAIVVSVTVYFILKKYFDHQVYIQQVEIAKQNKLQTVPMKMQAYERLVLFLERIRVHKLLVRFENKALDNAALCQTMMVGVEQEFEHNVVQQIYISQKLWEIILLAKNEVLHELNEGLSLCASNQDRFEMRNYFLKASSLGSDKAIEAAIHAIRSEVQLML